MKRRDVLKAALYGGSLISGGGLFLPGRLAHAGAEAVLSQRVLANIMLKGGPDFRHLLAPPFEANSSSYGYRHWQAKAAAHAIADSSSAWADRWNNDYYPVTDGQTTFGILKRCGWLKSMWDQGKVAVVCNASGGTSRNHAHCELVMEYGDLSTQPNELGRSGWGGRLASQAGGNVLSLTRIPRPFCFGPDPANPEGHDNRNLIRARNTREMTLFRPGPEYAHDSEAASLVRSLEGYYKAKGQELSLDSIYRRFIELEQSLREFGEPIDDRLQTVPLPASIAALMQGSLSSGNLGEQFRNLYDCIVCSDIINMRVASLAIGSWDSHRNQKDMIEVMFEDLFGDGKALDVLYSELPIATQDNLVFVIGGEFGRQLRANGHFGTDHGDGNNLLVIGNAVNGGVYGDMFPQGELERLSDSSPDITGLTTIDRIYAEVCDWVSPGSSVSVFPNSSLSRVEAGVSLGELFV
jgi:uncharacterized protein (DUF1501 family)